MEHNNTIWLDVEHETVYTRKEIAEILERGDIDVVGCSELYMIDGILYEVLPIRIVPFMS